jgi:Domain of unknown function (DUF6894)
MTCYFILLREGDTLLPDDGEGQEFASFDAVRREAIESARHLLSQAALSGEAGRLNQTIEVQDETGKIVLSVPVGHATGTEVQT